MHTSLKFNPTLQHLPVYQPGRPLEEVARELGFEKPDHFIKLASNENPLGPSPKARQAMMESIATAHLYPDGNAFYLKQRLCQKLDLNPENIILGNGSNEIIEFTGHALMSPETEVVFSEYSFAIYPIVTHMFGARPVQVPARQFGHDLPAMLSRVTDRTSVVFVANPNNPTGTLAPRADVVQLINEIPDHTLLVMDEAYYEYLKNPVDLLPLIRRGDHPNLLLMRTFSKIYGLAGLRIGYGIGHPDVISRLEKVRQPFNTNALAQAAALAALDDNEHLRLSKSVNEMGLEQFELALRKLEIPFVPSYANFILVQVGDGKKVFEDLQKMGIITRPMAGYGLKEWLRISIGTREQNTRCIEALQSLLAPV